MDKLEEREMKKIRSIKKMFWSVNQTKCDGKKKQKLR